MNSKDVKKIISLIDKLMRESTEFNPCLDFRLTEIKLEFQRLLDKNKKV